MFRIALLSAVLVAGFGTAPAFAERNDTETIPPNCTLDPFTGKTVCHIWPTCTIDPWTHKMNCPVPKATMSRRD